MEVGTEAAVQRGGQYTVRKVFGVFRADPIPELRDHSRYPAREYELDETDVGPLIRFHIVGPKVIDPHWVWHDRFGPVDPLSFFLKERERYLKDPKWIVTDKVAPDEVIWMCSQRPKSAHNGQLC